MGTVSYRLLGPLAVLRDGARADLGPEQRQRILAALLLKSNQAVTPAELVAAAWDGEPPANAKQLVGEQVDVLRELVDPSRVQGVAESLITLADGNYVLCVEPGDSDLSQFNGVVADAGELQAEGKHQEAAAKLRTALALWRGTPLEGLSGRVFDEARARLVEARRQAQDTLADLDRRLSYERPSAARTPPSPPPAVPSVPQAPTTSQAQPPNPPQAPMPWPVSSPGYGMPQPMQAPRPSVATLVVLKLLGAAVPIVTVGFFGWLLAAGIALKRRSIALGLSAAAYLAMTVWFTAYVLVPEDPEISDGQGLVSLLYFAAAIACSVQAAVVIGSPNRRGRQQPPYLLHPQSPRAHSQQLQSQQPPPVTYPAVSAYPPPATYPSASSYPPPATYAPQPMGYPPAPSADAVLRHQARQLANTQPALARSLGIGRPDLPRQYDDGGLIDLNDAPADLLDTLPGITGRQAAAIVVSRAQYGRFRMVDELWTRGLLPAHLAPQLTDRLVIIDIQDSAGSTG